jgi:hypothetical protein
LSGSFDWWLMRVWNFNSEFAGWVVKEVVVWLVALQARFLGQLETFYYEFFALTAVLYLPFPSQVPSLRVESLRVLEVCTTLLQECAAAGLTLAEIAGVATRPLIGMEEEPSELERICFNARAEVEDISDSDIEEAVDEAGLLLDSDGEARLFEGWEAVIWAWREASECCCTCCWRGKLCRLAGSPLEVSLQPLPSPACRSTSLAPLFPAPACRRRQRRCHAEC